MGKPSTITESLARTLAELPATGLRMLAVNAHRRGFKLVLADIRAEFLRRRARLAPQAERMATAA